MTIYGKALLAITRTDSDIVPYEVRSFVQSCSATGRAPGYNLDYAAEASENFGLLETETLPLPVSGRRLRIGDTVRVWVQYAFHYHRDSLTDEWDVDVEYGGLRVLRRQRARRRKFASSQK